jgi:hypothetical protein
MNLILSNGYPFPYPDGLTEAQQEEISLAAPSYRLVVAGVTHFEQKFTTTAQFRDNDAYATALAITGWKPWSPLVLEAPTSAADGYDYPAIIVGNVAYCGYQLVEHKEPLLPLFYVRDADGDQDQLVRAATAADALIAWRTHFELDADTDPTYIGRVPLDTTGAIPWEPITDSALQFKPMPD